MIRRGFLGGLIAMTIPGAGGQQQRPFTATGQQTPTGVQAGVSAGVDFARVLVVFGPSGAVNGVFIYQAGTTPKSGNGPLLSGTLATKDLYGNATQQGWVSYAAPGSSTYAALLNAHLALNFAGMASPALVEMIGQAQVSMLSGTTGVSDSPAAVSATSKNANGGARLVSMVADQVQLGAAVSNNIPISSAGITTVAQVVTALKAVGIFS